MKRIISVLVCAIMLLSTVGCFKTPQDQPQKSYEEQKALYNDIIAQYTSLLTAKQNGEELTAPDTADMDQREADISEALYTIVNKCSDAQALGYAFKDFDGNGTPELILLIQRYSQIVRAIFTLSNDKPVLLEWGYDLASGDITLATKNRFFIFRKSVNGNIEENTFYTCRVEGDKMVYDAIYGKIYDQSKKETTEIFQITDGSRVSISENDFDDLYREYKKTTDFNYATTSKLLTPRIHFPLKNNTANENLSVADFSSYAAIRETYKKISTCIDKFDSSQFHSGAYDDLFTFPSDLSFEYYIRLLYGAPRGDYRVGYDEIDLNGDGTDELVLLHEDYRILAIFTQKDGIPVLLDAFAYETCWLDEKGFIHVNNEQYYELEYNLYEFTPGGKYNLIYSVLVADNGNRYLTQNGKTERITFERSLELYDEYCCYPEPFGPCEYTRNVSDLTYTPLVSPTEDIISAATDQTWHRHSDLEEMPDKEWPRSNTYISFENATDAQMTISLKYVFTYSYPDPDRENYLLDNSTESVLKLTARKENGMLVFEENGVKGRIEFGYNHLWLVIEESTDQRFPVGHYCFEQYPQDLIS